MKQGKKTRTINKLIRIIKHAVSAIDHVITNYIGNRDIENATIRADISDHSPIVKGKEKYEFKRLINKSSVEAFKL